MGCTRDKIELEIISFIKSLGIEVHTTTKALGHQGFFRRNRIDISKNIKKERIIPTLLHEFAHYIIYNITPVAKDLTLIFKNNSDILFDELINITKFIDSNSSLEKLYLQKTNIKNNILSYEDIIKKKYPNFKRTEKFKPFFNYSKFSDLKYLEKYDAVKILKWFNYKTYSIINLEKDFPDIPVEIVSYLKLRSCQRRQASITRKINKIKKYYKEPTELFARFVEGLYIDINKTKSIAPTTYKLFKKLYFENYYSPLEKLFDIVNISL